MILVGDCLEQLKTLDDNSVDAMITDPPAGIGFMNKNWDKDKGGRDKWIAWLAERLEEAYRVLKPGAHILVWALPRTSHWTGFAVENAGFEIRDRVSHLFGTGFPKAANISKQIDKAAGAKREVIGTKSRPDGTRRNRDNWTSGTASVYAQDEWTQKNKARGSNKITEAATDDARQWEGWATALKPACEDWWLARKPFKGAAYKNVLKHGTGALNIDASRIGTTDEWKPSTRDASDSIGTFKTKKRTTEQHRQGRWPAHVILSHSPDCQPNGTKVEKGHKGYPKGPGGKSVHWGEGTKRSEECRTEAWEGIPDQETVAWECAEDCAVAMLDAQGGETSSGKPGARRSTPAEAIYGLKDGFTPTENVITQYGDKGGASRFFYCAKPPQKEKHAGLDEKNPHPTVKSVKLMRWLIRLITPPGGVVLDPFFGSGSTGIACVEEGFEFIGIEQSEEYASVASKRIEYAMRQQRIAEVKAEREART